jgi:hypothetical protein
MRVILKPAGLAIILVAFASLSVMLIWSRKAANNANSSGQNTAGNTAAATSASSGASSSSLAAAPSPTPGNWRKILEPDIASPQWRSLLTSTNALVEVVDADVPDHPKARRVTMAKIGQKPWEIQIAHPLDAAFQKGWHIRLSFFARSKQSCSMAAVVEQAKDPYTKVMYRKVDLTPNWKQYTEEWVQESDTPSGWAHVDFQTGYKVGEIEITGVAIEVIGKNKSARP